MVQGKESMICPNCGSEMDQRKKRKYRYLESGLRNVDLRGITIYACPECKAEMPEIPRLNQLHLVIGLKLISKHSMLNSEEVRFLLKELGMQSKEFAATLGYTPQHMSRIENGNSELSKQGVRLIRLLFLFKKEKAIGKYKAELETFKKILSRAVESFKKISDSHEETPISINMPEVLTSAT